MEDASLLARPNVSMYFRWCTSNALRICDPDTRRFDELSQLVLARDDKSPGTSTFATLERNTTVSRDSLIHRLQDNDAAH